MRLAAMMLTMLAACAAPQPAAEDAAGLPYVEIGEGSGFSGSTTFRVLADGRWTLDIFDPFAAPVSRQGDAGPAAHAAARAAALEGIAALGPVSPVACPDYGTDFVTVSDGDAVVAEVSAACPGTGVPEVILAVRQAFSAAAP